jgi:hypothetical protein
LKSLGLNPADYIKPNRKESTGPTGGGGLGIREYDEIGKTYTPNTTGTYLIIKNPTLVKEEEFVDFVRKIYEIESKKR